MIIARYVCLLFVGTVVMTQATLVTLVTAVTLVENAGILANQQAGGATALGMALFGGIDYAYQMLPIACFMGTLAAGCGLAQRGELLAIEALGLGRLRIAVPILLMTAGLAACASACAETVMPKAAAERARLQREQIQRVDALTQFYHRRNPWYRQGPWLLYLPELDTEAQRFMHPVIDRIDDSVLSEHIEAEALTHSPSGWWLHNARQERLAASGVLVHRCLSLPLAVQPEDLIDVTGNPHELGTQALVQLIARRARAGFDTAGHQIELYTRLAHPLSALGLVALALPWSLNPERRRTLPASVGPGIAVVAVYLFAVQVFRLLALAHKVGPALGALGAALVVLAALPVSAAAYRRWR